MTRRDEDQILGRSVDSFGTQAAKKRGRPRKPKLVFPKDIRASIPVGGHSTAHRLAYGFSLMALGQAGVYGERCE